MSNIEDAGLKGRVLMEIHGEEYSLANVRAVAGMMKKPLFHFYPVDTEDVSKAITWAIKNNVQLACKSGGQNVSELASFEL